MRDLYMQLGDELRSMLKEAHDPKSMQRRMKAVMNLASQIGEPIHTQTKLLQTALETDPQTAKQNIMKLEQETREL